ncbi:hypothetical protein C7212DRAFT_306947 [Tuber magnatum]|uniref:Uncharacterized protein n=1 Tax=Tuber magnatum TaxID=42249 RepID=A0A317T3J4_9PEZI|nr:hypothetical protein C7212DRAFT_306947 [Tuber magnatum]
MGFTTKGRIGKSANGWRKKNAGTKVSEYLEEVLTDYNTKIGISPERAAVYGDCNISSRLSNLRLDTGNEEASGYVACDRCTQKYPSTLEGREDLTRHGLISHDLKHICNLLKIKMPDFKAQMQVFTQDQLDVYVIALISTYRAVAVKRGLMAVCAPAVGTPEEIMKAHSESLCYEMII